MVTRFGQVFGALYMRYQASNGYPLLMEESLVARNLQPCFQGHLIPQLDRAPLSQQRIPLHRLSKRGSFSPG